MRVYIVMFPHDREGAIVRNAHDTRAKAQAEIDEVYPFYKYNYMGDAWIEEREIQ